MPTRESSFATSLPLSTLLCLTAACTEPEFTPAPLASGTGAGGATTSGGGADETAGDAGEPGPPPYQPCDIFLQNCGEEEKCVPYAVQWKPFFGEVWNVAACVDLAPPAEQVGLGQPCSMPDGIGGGRDTCGSDAFCYFYDREGVPPVGECGLCAPARQRAQAAPMALHAGSRIRGPSPYAALIATRCRLRHALDTSSRSAATQTTLARTLPSHATLGLVAK